MTAIELAASTADDALGALERRVVDEVRDHVGHGRANQMTVAWFGSVARGDSTLDSDVALLMVFGDDVTSRDAEDLIGIIAAGVELWTDNSCNVFDVTAERLSEMVAAGDPMIASWHTDSRTFLGPELRWRLARA